jgi:hypothetical protein
MKNYIICRNCNTENPHYQHICVNCKSYLRERVVNIDLWKTFGLITESPVKGFKSIIYSEHKNFISLILLLAAVKFLIDSVFWGVFRNAFNPLDGFMLKYVFMLAGITAYVYLFSVVLHFIDKIAGFSSRIKDHFTVLTYSFLPYVFGLVSVFIIEVVVFGGYLFSKFPSPFDLKEFLAYTLLIFEFLLIAWGIFLTFMAAFAHSGKIFYSLLVSLLFNLLLFSGLYLFSFTFIK